MVLILMASLFISVYLAAAVAACILLDLALSRRLGVLVSACPRWQYLAVFAVLALLSPLFGRNWLGVAGGVGLIGAFLLAVYFRGVMSRRLLERVLDIACALSVLCSFFAVGQYLAMWRVPGFRPWSTFENANYYGMMIAFVVLFCVYRLMRKGAVGEKVYYGLVIAANLIGLVLCECRSAAGALLVAVPTMLLVGRKYRALPLLALSVGALLALFAVAPAVLPRVENLPGDLLDRDAIWSAALRGIARNPLFGSGLFSYHHLAAQLDGPVKIHAHNLLLDCLLNFGLVGTAALGGYFSGTLPALRTMAHTDRRLLALVVGMAAVTLAHGALDVTLLQVQPGLLFALVAALPGIYETRFSPDAHSFGRSYAGKSL